MRVSGWLGNAGYNLCEHCDALAKIVTDLVGPKVSVVLMKRVNARMHPGNEINDPKCDQIQPATY